MRAAFFAGFVARARKSSTGDDGHALAVFRMAPDRALQLAGVGLETSAGDRQVRAAERPIAQLRRERPMAGVVSRDDDQPRCPLVEAVDAARSRGASRRPP